MKLEHMSDTHLFLFYSILFDITKCMDSFVLISLDVWITLVATFVWCDFYVLTPIRNIF